MEFKKRDLRRYTDPVQSYLETEISRMALDIDKQKDQVIISKLKELGITLDIEEESKRRFPRFTTERKGNSETLWFDDGSTHGQRVVTFIQTNKDYSEDMTCGIKVEYSYY